MSFYPSEKSKGLNGLNDVNIVTPVDNDAPVYNSTTQKWENKPVVTGDLWVKNGVHNLLYNRTSGSNILGGITITTNSDKSITVGAGTSTSTDNIMVSGSSPSWSSAEQSLTKGQYRVSMQGSDVPITLVIEIEDDGVHGNITAQVTGNQVVTFTINRDCRIYAYLLISSGATVPSGTLKPMITSIDDPSTEYAPYAMTNRELTEKNEEHTISVGTRVALTTSDYSASADGYVSIYAPNTSDYCRIDINGLLVMRAIGGEAQSLFVRKGTNIRVNSKSNDSTANFYPLG